VKHHPALDIRSDAPDLVLARVDDFGPTAVEERGPLVRVFFSTVAARDRARAALGSHYAVQAIDVPDGDWARRSQENLQPITVGRITIVPAVNWPPPLDRTSMPAAFTPSQSQASTPLTIVIQPSMGFGTGHHATTRLCLAALQMIDVSGRFVLDVGTGSGVLAIAAVMLGATRALGIDSDPDAVQSARENLPLNPAAHQVTFEIAHLGTDALPVADVVTANLTGALLARTMPSLLGAVGAGGTLIVSGLLVPERDCVRRAFAPAPVIWEQEEDGWLGIVFQPP
jgi:ribosomal protein L11 methyltransferase